MVLLFQNLKSYYAKKKKKELGMEGREAGRAGPPFLVPAVPGKVRAIRYSWELS